MKRSKIFLGVTTSLLAIAGIAAANQHKNAKKVFFTTHVAQGVDPTGHVCTKFAILDYSLNPNGNPQLTNGSGYNVDLTVVNGRCTTPIYIGE